MTSNTSQQAEFIQKEFIINTIQIIAAMQQYIQIFEKKQKSLIIVQTSLQTK